MSITQDSAFRQTTCSSPQLIAHCITFHNVCVCACVYPGLIHAASLHTHVRLALVFAQAVLWTSGNSVYCKRSVQAQGFHYMTLLRRSVSAELVLAKRLLQACSQRHNLKTPDNHIRYFFERFTAKKVCTACSTANNKTLTTKCTFLEP